MNSKERNWLNGGTITGNAQQRQAEHYQETKNESRDCQVEVRRGRPDGSAQQQQCNAKHCDQSARDPDFPHV
jgi:hypothetical protein